MFALQGIRFLSFVESLLDVYKRQTFDWTRDKVEGMNQVLQEIGREADQSVVTVSSVKHQVDWFDNPVESTGQYAGLSLIHI